MTEKVKRYMDFMGPASTAPRKMSGDPLANRPAARSVAKTTSKTVAKAASKTPVKTAPKPSARPASVSKTAPKKPLKTASPAKDSDALAKKAAAALSGSNLKADLKASKYTLNGKSPFLPSYNVEKRPLSDSIKEKKVEEIPKKNVYEKSKKSEKSENRYRSHKHKQSCNFA